MMPGFQYQKLVAGTQDAGSESWKPMIVGILPGRASCQGPARFLIVGPESGTVESLVATTSTKDISGGSRSKFPGCHPPKR